MEAAAPESPDAGVSQEDLESLIAIVERQVPRAIEGIFGAESISWKINRESALFLGAGRAALLQLAHPWVAAALDQHSSLLGKPISRFHNTFRVVFTMIFGSSAQAFRAARSLHQLHTRIRGQIPNAVAGYPAGSAYEANQVSALLWVFATLIESALFAYECVLPPLNEFERSAYYAEAKTLAKLFGIPDSALPQDWRAFDHYIAGMYQSQALGITDRSRYMAHRILTGAGSWIPIPRWYRALTAEWLPPRFLVEFGLKFGSAEEESARSAKRWLPRLYRSLSPSIRFVGPYHEALRRLSNQAPGYVTRCSNNFWIGQPRLPFSGHDATGGQSEPSGRGQ
jgi:uncharacterized protein (DUF2236 family)